MQHFKPIISNDASLFGKLFPIVASHGLAGSKSGRSSLPVTVDEKFYFAQYYNEIHSTVKALIKTPLKNNYDSQRRLVWSAKILLRTLGGALFREAPSN